MRQPRSGPSMGASKHASWRTVFPDQATLRDGARRVRTVGHVSGKGTATLCRSGPYTRLFQAAVAQACDSLSHGHLAPVLIAFGDSSTRYLAQVSALRQGRQLNDVQCFAAT